MESLKDLLLPFARILEKSVPIYTQELELLKEHKHNISIAKELRQTLKWAIKHTGPLIPPFASEEAIRKTMGKIDIFCLKWEDQLKAESIIAGHSITNRKNCLLFHEHKTPVENTLERILATNGDKSQIIDILCSQEIAWILRQENKKLIHRNRGDHEKNYLDAGIVLKKNPYGLQWLEKTFAVKSIAQSKAPELN